jgi:hypothetical protein
LSDACSGRDLPEPAAGGPCVAIIVPKLLPHTDYGGCVLPDDMQHNRFRTDVLGRIAAGGVIAELMLTQMHESKDLPALLSCLTDHCDVWILLGNGI